MKKRGRKKAVKKGKNGAKSQPKKKCKRGYKFCKADDCEEMMNIHRKVCPKCGYKNSMKKKIQDNEKIVQLLTKKVNPDKKKHVTKGQLRKIKLYIENDIFKDKRYLGKRGCYKDFETEIEQELNKKKSKTKILKTEDSELETQSTKILLNGVDTSKFLTKNSPVEITMENEKIFLSKSENALNDMIILIYKEDKKKYIFVISGENRVKKIRNYPKSNSLIQYNMETQKIFKTEYLMSVGQKFPGNSKAEVHVFEFDLETKETKFLKKNEILLKNGDLMKISSPFKTIDPDVKSTVIGMILSDGSFKLMKFEISDFLDSEKNSKEIQPSLISFNKDDEIFSSFNFINPVKFLIGSQKGTIFLCKLKNKKIKILNSFNRYNNFLITGIAVMPTDDSEEEIFAYSTGDGFIKIQSTEDDYPLYEYQTISKTIRSLRWDLSTRALIYSDENEKFFVSFYYFNPSNSKHILSKKITKTKHFVEVISQIRGLDKTLLGDRKGNISTYDSNKSRLYFYKHKEILKLNIMIQCQMEEGEYRIWNRVEEDINRDKRMKVEEEPLVNRSTVFCLDGVKLSEGKGMIAFGNASGVLNFYFFSEEEDN